MTIHPLVRRHLTWVAPVTTAAVIVSFQAARPDPWRDELASWSAAIRTVPEIFELGRHIDGVLVPYYLLLHYWIGWFGDSPVAMRTPSMLAMTATAGMVALLARRFWGGPAGLLGGLLFAVLPVTSRYAQEARGYAFAMLFATLATVLLTYALDRPGRWRWLPYAGVVGLTGLSHLVSLLILAGHLVMVLFRAPRRVFWWLLATAAGVGAVVPLTVRGLGQRGAQLDWLGPATPAALADIAGTVFEAPVLGGVVATLAVAALRHRDAVPLWATVLLPVGLLYAYDQWITPIFVGRYLLFAVPLLCALAGAGLAALRRPAAPAVVLVAGLIGLPAQGEIRREHSGFDYRSAAAVLADSAQPGDAVIYAPRQGWQLVDTGIAYYLGDRAPRDVLRTADETAAASLWATECADPAACLTGVDRVWVVAADNIDPAYTATATNQLNHARQAALQPYEELARWRVEGFTITLFVVPPA